MVLPGHIHNVRKRTDQELIQSSTTPGLGYQWESEICKFILQCHYISAKMNYRYVIMISLFWVVFLSKATVPWLIYQ